KPIDQQTGGSEMKGRVLQLIGVCTVMAAVILLLKLAAAGTPGPAAGADTPGTKSSGLKTPWGEPDLQGIWTDEYQTPLQRPANISGSVLAIRAADGRARHWWSMSLTSVRSPTSWDLART